MVVGADGVLVRGALPAAPGALAICGTAADGCSRGATSSSGRCSSRRPSSQLGGCCRRRHGRGRSRGPGQCRASSSSSTRAASTAAAWTAPTRPSSWLFTESLEQLLEPLAAPRYVVARYVLAPDGRARARPLGDRSAVRAAVRRAMQRARPSGVEWHPVPTALGVNAARAGAFAAAWDRWVGPTELLYTGSPEGAGVLAAQQGSDPFDATTVIRRQWS